MRWIWVAYGVLMLTLTGLAGVLSSWLAIMLAPVYGVRSALFGAILGLGVLLTSGLSRGHLRSGRYPRIDVALGVAALSGCAAAGILAWHGHAFPLRNDGDFPAPPYLTGLRLCVTSLLYAILLHGVYAARGVVKHPHWVVLLGSLAAGVAGGALRAALASTTGRWDLEQFAITALFSGPPFCLLWMIAVRIADPGWSPRRMVKTSG
jgi:hypothetical protein